METSQEPKPSLARRVLKTATAPVKWFWQGINPEIPKIPPKEINEATVAGVIINYLGNPLQEKLGRSRWANGFSLPDILANSGYVPLTSDTDYFQKFPVEYAAVRQAVRKLADDQILATIPLKEPDNHSETIRYQVINEDKLRQLAVEYQPSEVQQNISQDIKTSR